ncbi:hypothetical protein, partial [Victivallis vadensis]|uniref:hypothetical protein n=1 Tax=Victivallis vadensis TaxID=172901 RepID=UPI003AF773E2
AQKLLPSGQFCLFLTQCEAEYKTHMRLESGDESPHSKDALRRWDKPNGDVQGRFAPNVFAFIGRQLPKNA